VALDLKKMDYLALDDRNANAGGRPISLIFNSKLNVMNPGASDSKANSKDEREEQRIDPLLPLLFAHPENASAPDSSVALTPEELQSKAHSFVYWSQSRTLFLQPLEQMPPKSSPSRPTLSTS
jgi:UDP-glucose:glycoprotein glucosyltransferase